MIVIAVTAFVLVACGGDGGKVHITTEDRPGENFGQLLTQLKSGDIKSVTMHKGDNTLDVTEGDGTTKYRTTYPESYEQALEQVLRKEHIAFSVDG